MVAQISEFSSRLIEAKYRGWVAFGKQHCQELLRQGNLQAAGRRR